MSSTRHVPFVVWLAIPLVAGGALIALLLPRVLAPKGAGAGSMAADPSPSDPVTERTREVLEMGRAPGANAGKLIAAYGAWAKEPGALVARRMILDAILKQDSYAAKVAALAEAVEGSALPPEEDPLWPQAVAGIAAVWTPQNLAWGLDQMVSEERPRARQLLMSSLTRLALSDGVGGFDEKQRLALVSDFIDVKTKAPASVRADIEEVIRKLSPPVTETWTPPPPGS